MITKTPAIGKYIVGQSIMTYGFSGNDFGKITKISGTRIYYTDDNGIEKYMNKYSAICDTFEEVKILQNFSRSCVKEVSDLNKKHRLEFNSLFE